MMALVPLFITTPSKVPFSMVPSFLTPLIFWKVPPLMLLWFSTVLLKVPPRIVPNVSFVTFPSKVPLSLMVPLFVTLHVFWKAPPLMVPLFVTLPAKVPPEIVPPALFITLPSKVPFSMVPLL